MPNLSKPITIPISAAMKDSRLTATIRVSGLRMFTFRMRLAQALIWMAGHVAGFANVDVGIDKGARS